MMFEKLKQKFGEYREEKRKENLQRDLFTKQLREEARAESMKEEQRLNVERARERVRNKYSRGKRFVEAIKKLGENSKSRIEERNKPRKSGGRKMSIRTVRVERSPSPVGQRQTFVSERDFFGSNNKRDILTTKKRRII